MLSVRRFYHSNRNQSRQRMSRSGTHLQATTTQAKAGRLNLGWAYIVRCGSVGQSLPNIHEALASIFVSHLLPHSAEHTKKIKRQERRGICVNYLWESTGIRMSKSKSGSTNIVNQRTLNNGSSDMARYTYHPTPGE